MLNVIFQGREKMPAYWLGAFFNPRGLLAILKQDCYRHHANDRSGAIEQFVFQTEITARDKDHVSIHRQLTISHCNVIQSYIGGDFTYML